MNIGMAAICMVVLCAGMASAETMVHNLPGSSSPGCETTLEGCFIPSVVEVGVGDTITWVNDDTATHTVTSGILDEGGADGIFDSGSLPPADMFSHTFESAGEHPYFCMVHPWMKGLVVVSDAYEHVADEYTLELHPSWLPQDSGLPDIVMDASGWPKLAYTDWFAGPDSTLTVSVGPSARSPESIIHAVDDALHDAHDISIMAGDIGTLGWWHLPDGRQLGAYVATTNSTTYVMGYSTLSGDGNARFERAVQSFVMHPVPELDPRCTGESLCHVGVVTDVTDGDTILIDGMQVQLALVETPEPGTMQGDMAHTIVRAVCQIGSGVTIDEDDGQVGVSEDFIVGVVWCGQTNLNEFLVDIGYGMVAEQFCPGSEFAGEPWAAACG